MKHKTELTLPVVLTFEVLPEMEVEGTYLPAQIDITKILLTISGPSGKPRQVDITNSVSEDQMMAFEDDIMENYE